MNKPAATGTEAVFRDYAASAAIFAVAAAALYLCAQLVLPFLTPLVLALVLAILAAPLLRIIERRIKIPSLAATIVLLIVCAIVLVPLTPLIVQLVQDAAAGAVSVRAKIDAGLIQQTLSAHPTIAAFAERVLGYVDASGVAGAAARWLTDVSANFVRGSVTQFAGMLLIVYLLFYFLRDARLALDAARRFVPFTDAETDLLFMRIVDTVRAIVYGTVIMGVVKGVLGAAIFAAAGLPAPLFWGFVMGLFAILPVVGTGLVWIPAAVFLAADGRWLASILLTGAFGLIVVFDTFVYPVLVGNRLRFHSVVVFIAAAGGLIVFGPIGFILGPLIVAVSFTVRDILAARYRVSSEGQVP